MEKVRIIELPKCTMAASGFDPQGDFTENGLLGKFCRWFLEEDKKRADLFFPRDFLWYNKDKKGYEWYYALTDSHIDPKGYQTISFPGGFYAVAASAEENELEKNDVLAQIYLWIADHEKIALDESRQVLFHRLTKDPVKNSLGYHQLDHYVPIQLLSK